jgi:hypothetical protein
MKTGILQSILVKRFGLFPALFGFVLTANSQFIAFNDHIPGTGTGPNVTTWSVNTNNIVVNPNPLPLKDVTSGATLGVTLQYITNRVAFANSSANPFPGTPAYTNFHGYVDFGSGSGSSIELVALQNSAVTNVLSGLDTNKIYTFRGTAVRGGSPASDYNTRCTLFTLLGAASFRSAHTAGAITGALDPALGANQVAISTGANTNSNQGDMADWEEIHPLSNTLMIVSTHYSNNVVVSPAGFACNGVKGYAMSGFQLIETVADPNSLSITAPADNANYVLGQTIVIGVGAGANIQNVSFYDGTSLLGSDSAAPYSLSYSNATLGNHALKAVGSTSSGSVTSAPVTIHVNQNQAPSISITNPIGGRSFLVGTNVRINAAASDPDNGLAGVDFYIDGSFFYRETTSPYFVEFNDTPAGTHTLIAVAVDNGGLSVTSAPVSITITNPPDVLIVIPNRSVWKYLDDGSDQGTAWRGAFNDSSWKSGPAELGYGDGVQDANNANPKPEQTVINGGPVNNRYITTYFRRTFNVASPASITNLIVNLLRDDGGVVYINGQEVFRSNATNPPTGEILYNTLAPSNAGDDGTIYTNANVSPSFLVAGANTIAVEIHQSAVTSSDISFDLMLFAQPATGGRLSANVDASNARIVNITWTGGGILQDSSDISSPANWHDVSPAPSGNTYSVNTGTAGPQKFYRLR